MLDKFLDGIQMKRPAEKLTPEAELEFDRYDRIFRSSRAYAFVDWDMISGDFHWRGGLLSYMGYDEKTIADSLQASELTAFIYPEDRERLDESFLQLIKNKDHPGYITYRGIKSDGTPMWMEIRLEAERREDGWVTHLSGLISDISALKAAEDALMVNEARHARIIQASNDGLWEWSVANGGKRLYQGRDGRLNWSHRGGGIAFNSRCWEMLGYDGSEEVVLKGLTGWRSLMHPDDGLRFDNAVIQHVSFKRPFDIEYRIRTKSGPWCWIRARGQASYDDEGKPKLFSGTNIDITELKRAEENVVRAKEEAESANLAKSEFLSSMSHELRTPLNAILGFTQLFELDNTLSAEQQSNIHEIKTAGNHLLELVGDVLDLARIEAGHVELNFSKVLPSRIIHECVVLLNSQYEQRHLNLELEFNGLESRTIIADESRFRQVLLNLMGNAGKYNKKGGVVKIECSLIEGARMRISVEDSGVGIPVKLQSELFQPFNRLGAENSSVGGTGIGLVITQQLVEQMDGEINFESQEKVGSRFWVDFPFSKSFGSNVGLKKIANAPVIMGKSDTPELTVKGVKRVLYVEDNPSNQKLMEQVLAKYPQIELTVVGLAVQGLFLARSTNPDLIILDVSLPGVTGHEMVEILKSDPLSRHMPVIALSANVLPHDVERGKAAGFDRYLTKPLNIEELISACNELIT